VSFIFVPTTDQGPWLIFECGDTTEAERLVAELPIVEAGLLNFEVVPLRPYAGLRQLFGNPS
jgi:hypothetical protein